MEKNHDEIEYPFPNKISDMTVEETLMDTKELKKIKKAARSLSRALSYVRDVCKAYKKCRQIEEACKKCKKNSNMFYYYLRKHDECRDYAKHFGLGIVVKPDPVEPLRRELPEIAKEQPPVPAKARVRPAKVWTAAQKKRAIESMTEVLKIGAPFDHAVRYSGASMRAVKEWMDADNEIREQLLQAESSWAVYFFKCLSTAAKVAAEKGKFAELVDGAERRFAQHWAKVQAIDLTIKNETNGNEIQDYSKRISDTIETQFEQEE